MTFLERELLSALERLAHQYAEREALLHRRLDNLMRELVSLRTSLRDLSADVKHLRRVLPPP